MKDVCISRLAAEAVRNLITLRGAPVLKTAVDVAAGTADIRTPKIYLQNIKQELYPNAPFGYRPNLFTTSPNSRPLSGFYVYYKAGVRGDMNTYDIIATIHNGGNREHRGSAFLSWHRMYLLLYEAALQAVFGQGRRYSNRYARLRRYAPAPSCQNQCSNSPDLFCDGNRGICISQEAAPEGSAPMGAASGPCFGAFDAVIAPVDIAAGMADVTTTVTVLQRIQQELLQDIPADTPLNLFTADQIDPNTRPLSVFGA
ncbi:TYR [Mytilus coruscus]|uniref:TYR n=1 Tax=Mytilus coruscus TaxID=42192 RepID=A0A6J8DKI8_MYTCO|nr:TYR [Mytilus coruscus]